MRGLNSLVVHTGHEQSVGDFAQHLGIVAFAPTGAPEPAALHLHAARTRLVRHATAQFPRGFVEDPLFGRLLHHGSGNGAVDAPTTTP